MIPTTVLLRNYYERDVAVDDVTGDAMIPIRIRRFTKDQLMAFSLGWSRCEHPPSDRYVYRKPEGDEQVIDGKRYVIGTAEIRRRRMAEMSPEDLAAFELAETADAQFIGHFCAEAIRDHVWVAPQARVLVEDDQGETRPVRTGDELADMFAGNLSILLRLAQAIHEENTLGPAEKKTLKRWSASMTTSPTLAPAVVGPTPDATAASAAMPASVSPVDALDLPDPIPSFETA